jgi:hypothetical protein
MNRNRRLTVVGATAAGLIGLATLTGAASASAATTSAPAPSAPSVSAPSVPAPAKPAPAGEATNKAPGATKAPEAQKGPDAQKPAEAQKPADAQRAAESKKAADAKARSDAKAKADRGSDRSGNRAVARVKAVVVAKYPKVTVNSVHATSNGWTVGVTTSSGDKATVTVDKNLQVGRLVLARSSHHGG